VNGEPMAWRKQLFPRPVEGEPFYRSCGIAVPDSAGRPDMGRLQRLPGMLGAVCRYGGGRVFVSKYLANNHHIPALAELFRAPVSSASFATAEPWPPCQSG
jgi:hypothetical protein